MNVVTKNVITKSVYTKSVIYAPRKSYIHTALSRPEYER